MTNMNAEVTIIKKLQKGAVLKAALIVDIMATLEVTLQAVYKSFRKLKTDGIIVFHGGKLNKKVSLSMWHVEKEYSRWKNISAAYQSKLSYGDFVSLAQNKKQTIYFDNYNDLDRYWVTSFLLLERILPQDLPSYTLMPHDWYLYAEIESDMYWNKASKRKQRLVITNPFEIDTLVARERRRSGYEVTVGADPFKQSDCKHFSIVGDWIFEVDFDEGFTKELVLFIERQKSIASVDKKTLKKIIARKGQFKMTIHHNEKKSAEMTKKVKKYFE